MVFVFRSIINSIKYITEQVILTLILHTYSVHSGLVFKSSSFRLGSLLYILRLQLAGKGVVGLLSPQTASGLYLKIANLPVSKEHGSTKTCN